MNYKICDLCEVTSSRRIFAREYTTCGVPFFRSQEVIESSLHGHAEPMIFISEGRYNQIIQSKLPVPKKGDILLSAIGANRGYPWHVDIDRFYFKDGNVIWLRNFIKNCNPSYLCYYLGRETVITSMQRASEHSAQGALTIDLIKSLEIELPDLIVQQHIVNTIGSIDDLIENYQQEIDKICELLDKSLLQYLNKVEISVYKPRLIKSGIDSFSNSKEYLDTSSVEGVNNISAGEEITISKRPSRANMQPVKNSVWFAKMKGSCKKLIITDDDSDLTNHYILSTGFQGLLATKELPLSLLSAFVISKDFDVQRDLHSVGTTMAGINNETFMKMMVPQLSAQEIGEFDKKYSPFVKLLSERRKEITKLKALKQQLLQKYF